MVKRVTKEDRRRAEEQLLGVNRPKDSKKTPTKRGYRGSIKKLQRSINHLESSLGFLGNGLLNTELMESPEVEEIKSAIRDQKVAISKIKKQLEEMDKTKKESRKRDSSYDDLKLENSEPFIPIKEED